jgi:hypothetical protein
MLIDLLHPDAAAAVYCFLLFVSIAQLSRTDSFIGISGHLFIVRTTLMLSVYPHIVYLSVKVGVPLQAGIRREMTTKNCIKKRLNYDF